MTMYSTRAEMYTYTMVRDRTTGRASHARPCQAVGYGARTNHIRTYVHYLLRLRLRSHFRTATGRSVSTLGDLLEKLSRLLKPTDAWAVPCWSPIGPRAISRKIW